jgi:hypothetical protein
MNLGYELARRRDIHNIRFWGGRKWNVSGPSLLSLLRYSVGLRLVARCRYRRGD